MAQDNYQKLRLQEFTDFDLERILKENIDDLDALNVTTLEFIDSNKGEVASETVESLAIFAQNNSAEVLNLTSILHHDENIYMHFTSGPLFRKDRDAK